MTAPPSTYSGAGGQTAPKKETARINILPEPVTPRAPTVKMAKTQPITTALPPPARPVVPVVVAKLPQAVVVANSTGGVVELLDSVPMPVCWIIFTISTVTLLIQIWNYLGS